MEGCGTSGVESPDRSAGSDSLYRPRYRGPRCLWRHMKQKCTLWERLIEFIKVTISGKYGHH